MFLTTLTLFEDCAFCDLVEKNREKQNQNVKRFRKAIGPVGNFEYQCRFHIPENDPGMLKKKIRMTFWNLNFSNFSKSNINISFICQSNIILAFIRSIDHTFQVNFCWDIKFPDTHSGIFSWIIP